MLYTVANALYIIKLLYDSTVFMVTDAITVKNIIRSHIKCELLGVINRYLILMLKVQWNLSIKDTLGP